MYPAIAKFTLTAFCLLSLVGITSGDLRADTQSTTTAKKSSTTEAKSDPRYLFNADEMHYDQAKQILTGRGHVEVHYQGRVLMADQIQYFRRDNRVVATGNVSLLDELGNVAFAEEIELKDGFKSGFIRNIRVLLDGNARFAANGARRYPDGRTEMSKAVFSPCRACEKDPDRPLTWQIKAEKIVHNRANREVEYHNAFLEVLGIPIAWAPNFRHPDPSVKRATGFLTPDFGSSSELGAIIATPYYFNLAPDRDLTVTPKIMTNEGFILGAHYRQLTAKGGFEVQANGAIVEERDNLSSDLGSYEFRNNIDAHGAFYLRDNWRWGFDLERASDDTFLERYGISKADTLTSDLYVERIRGRDYANVTAYAFQGLNVEDDNQTTPYVLPTFELEHQLRLPKGLQYGRLKAIANAANLYRVGGTDASRLSAGLTWDMPIIAPFGQLINLHLSSRLDGFRATSTGLNSGDAYDVRFWPKASAEWRLPMIATYGTIQHIIEPIAQVVIAPNGGNDIGIQNEDSLTVDFDTSNLFVLDRNNGFDRVEDGIRLNYGLATSFIVPNGGHLDFLAGQVIRFRDTNAFSANSGLQENDSDYVLQANLSPNKYFDLFSRFRFDNDGLELRRNEIEANVNFERANFQLNYLRLRDRVPALTSSLREEIFLRTELKVAENWTLRGYNRRDLTGDGNTLNAGIGVAYEDECIIFSISFDRDGTSDRDAPSSNSLNFRIVLKHLG